MSRPPISRAQRWLGLVLIATAQFVVIMDTSIIGVALPDIQRDLGFTPESLSWVFNAYVVAFGGLLLLGGRLADAFGARKIFVSGWIVLIIGSLLAGAATDVGLEIAGRAIQGAGSALIAPAALTLLMMLFGGTSDLPKAFAVYGAAAPIGGTAGVFLGGVLTEYASWPWVFYVTVPIALFVLAFTASTLPRTVRTAAGSIDVAGALTVTLGLAAVVYGVVNAPEVGWLTWSTLTFVGAGIVLLAIFFVIQARSRNPPAAPRAAACTAVGRGQQRPAAPRSGLGVDVVLPEPLPAAGPRGERIRRGCRTAADDGPGRPGDGRPRPSPPCAVRSQVDDRQRPADPRRRPPLAVVRPPGR